MAENWEILDLREEALALEIEYQRRRVGRMEHEVRLARGALTGAQGDLREAVRVLESLQSKNQFGGK